MNHTPIFNDRRHAGEHLAALVAQRVGTMDPAPIVLARPLGGVEVAEPIARRLGAGLDLVLVRELCSPSGETVGAAAHGGVVVRDWRAHQREALEPPFDHLREWAQGELDHDFERYGAWRRTAQLAGRVVLIVDDVLTNAAVMLAAVESCRPQRPTRIVVAAAIVTDDARRDVEPFVDDLVCVGCPIEDRAAQSYFADFRAPQQDEVIARLMAVNHISPPLDIPAVVRAA